jgi:hypothetical protein
MSPLININISNWPISWVERELFVNTMLIMKNITAFINWASCSPEILSMNFSFLKPEKICQNYFLITIKRIINCAGKFIFFELSKDSN